MGGNICKKKKFKNAQMTQFKKWANNLNRHFSKKSSKWQKVHAQIFDTANHPGNENQTHNEISPHTC